MALEVGLQAALVHVVANDDTAAAVGSGDVPMLATPRLLALAEAACIAALGDAGLPAESTTVGTRVELEHLLALAVGETVRVAARLDHLDGRLLRFEVVATDDGDRLVARAVDHPCSRRPKAFPGPNRPLTRHLPGQRGGVAGAGSTDAETVPAELGFPPVRPGARGSSRPVGADRAYGRQEYRSERDDQSGHDDQCRVHDRPFWGDWRRRRGVCAARRDRAKGLGLNWYMADSLRQFSICHQWHP